MDLTNFIITINIVAPVFIIILLGFLFRKINLINETFASLGSKLVFNVALPTLIFLKLINKGEIWNIDCQKHFQDLEYE